VGLSRALFERRLGVAGQGRSQILSRLADTVPAPSTMVAGRDVGLSADGLQRLAAEWQFGSFGDAFPTRSGADRLSRIAWFGAVLADISCSPACDERDQVLREGALFNLAVALFDTVADDQPSRLAATAKALQPELLMLVLRDGVRLPSRNDAAVDLLVDLFNDVLRSMNRRLRHSPVMIDRLGGLLDQMYRSELGVDHDRLAAKFLPTVFIGLLGDRRSSAAIGSLHLKLSRFIAMWDDWQDLADDVIRRRANLFAYDGYGWSISNVVRLGWRLIGGRVSHAQIATALRAVIDETVRASYSVPQDARVATLYLLRFLLGQE
jgi:hypothetical protein